MQRTQGGVAKFHYIPPVPIFWINFESKCDLYVSID
jgi:hypothetical protein